MHQPLLLVMKLAMWGGSVSSGFSTIELLIALALMLTIIASALDANASAQYWRMSAVTAHEALVKVTSTALELRIQARRDFETVVSTPKTESRLESETADTACIQGSWCYVEETHVTDVSSCVKIATVSTTWKIAARYPTSTVSDVVTLTKLSELVAAGADCVLRIPSGQWLHSAPQLLAQATHTAQFSTGADWLSGRLYVVASSVPQLRVYQSPEDRFGTFALVGTSSVNNNRLNAIDVIRDLTTGRLYAYVVQHTLTEQLLVLDVTDDRYPIVVTTRTLSGVAGSSFPQGWRVVVYGNRVYVVTRETAGPELHIFSIIQPQNPIELNSGLFNLGRTVNDMVVREQLLGGEVRRFLFLAASAALKEFAIIDVTHDISREVAVVNVPGSEDMMSMSLVGSLVYLGRKNSPSGPELFIFDSTQLLSGSTTLIATAEVSGDVTSLRVVGPLLFLGTNKSGSEFQVWQSDYVTWNPLVVNAGRVSARSQPRLVPLGVEVGNDFLYLLSQSNTQPEILSAVYTP